MLSLVCLCGAILLLPMLNAQSPHKVSARLLDSLLQDYAFRAFDHRGPVKTGIVYNGSPPSNLTGIDVSALRLRSGNLRKGGFHSYKEFHIPVGVLQQPFKERLVLVYHNLGNWSSFYYPLPGYTYLAPVVGILAYDASNLSATNIPELNIRASDNPILIKFRNVKSPTINVVSVSSPVCVYFDIYGSVKFDNVLHGNICSATKQGHFSIVLEFTAPSPAANAAKAPPARGDSMLSKYKEFIIVGSVVCGVVLVMILATVVILVQTCRSREKILKMEEASSSISVTSIGSVKVPVADATRTRPTLEGEYVI